MQQAPVQQSSIQDRASHSGTPESIQAPISEAEFHDLYLWLDLQLEESPCNGSLQHTFWYVRSRQWSEGDVMDWLVQQVGTCDGAVLRCAEAYFAETRFRGQNVQMDALNEALILARGDGTTGHDGDMPLSEDDFYGLCDALEGVDCDGSLHNTRSYLREQQLAEAAVIPWLEKHGGFCDCEVLFNVALC